MTQVRLLLKMKLANLICILFQLLDHTVTSVVRRLSLPAGETFTLDTEKIVLDAGDSVQVNGSAPASGTGRLACTVSYLDIT